MAATRRKTSYKSAPRRSRALDQATVRLADKIRSLRDHRGLTQQRAADIAQIETKHWQLMESGGGNPTLATLLAVARALGVEVFELLR